MTNTRRFSPWFCATALAAVLLNGCVEADDKKDEPPPAQPAPVVVPPEPPRAALTLEPGATYTIATAANKCLQFLAGSKDDVAQAEIATCTSPANKAQQFTLQTVPGGYHAIINVNSGKCLDVAAYVMTAGARVQQYTCNGGANQNWIIADGGGGTYRFVARHSGKVLEVTGGGTADGTVVSQNDWKSAANQQFKLKPAVVPANAGAGGAPGGKSGAGGSSGHKSRKHAEPKPAATPAATPKP